MKTRTISSARYLLVAAGLALVTITVGCNSAPEPAQNETVGGPGQAELAEKNQEIEELRAEVERLEGELRSLEQAAAVAARAGDDAETAPGEHVRSEGGGRAPDGEATTNDVEQLRRENERLRDLTEELRLALTAVGVDAPMANLPMANTPTPAEAVSEGRATQEPPPRTDRRESGMEASQVENPPPESEPESEPEMVPGSARETPAGRAPAPTLPTGEIAFRRVDSVTPPLEDRTPSQLREQQVLRLPTGGGGYAYVDERANSSDGEGLYLELHLLPDMRVPDVRLRATAVYPVENTSLGFSEFTLAEGEELFEFRISDIDRRRSGRLAAESLTAPMQPELRRLLVFLQRRPMAELLLTFHGAEGERSHRVTRNELLALGNMIYTMREMGVDL